MRKRDTLPRLLVLAVLFGGGRAAGSFVGEGPTDASANGALTPCPQLEAHRIVGTPIVVDGRLDDPEWQLAQAATGFRTWDPVRGNVPSEETVFKVAYDDDALYVGVACLEKDPAHIATQLCRRDSMSDSDVVSLYLDTYHDHTTGYNFRVNPLGCQQDIFVFNDGEMDRDWDAVWQAETCTDGGSWNVEIRIPFSAVRYRPADEMTWGLQLYRYMHARGEDTAWVTWDNETRGFVSRFGELHGLRGIPAARQIELLPYAVGSATNPAAPPAEDGLAGAGNLGLDVKYGVTSDLTLNATFQPDFGQVEADPAVLNLSPFETQYDEKRPFFIEGNRFFTQPHFDVFYSRRIGTGDPNSRIRFAGKLTGKTKNGVSIAALYAATDVAGDGQAHNFLKSGEQLAHYGVARFGREFAGGMHRVNVMQTAVVRTADRDAYGDLASRDALTTAADFELNFRDRDYRVTGSVVGSSVDPAALGSDPAVDHERRYGTAGLLSIAKLGGTVLGGMNGSWQTDEVDLNDVGYLRSPDDMDVSGWVEYAHNPNDADAFVAHGGVELDVWRSWLYAPGDGLDRDTGDLAWSYDRGHPQSLGAGLSSWCQFRSFWTASAGGGWNWEGTSKFETRSFEGHPGPLLTIPASSYVWANVGTDWRRPIAANLYGNVWRSEAGGSSRAIEASAGWTPTRWVSLNLSASYSTGHDDAQHLGNFANPGAGIGGVSYIFAELDQRTIDGTLRADVLFSRDVSLQLYAQPYLTVGEYGNPRELVHPDSYELGAAAGIPNFDPGEVDAYDFRFSAVNVNAVFRWEYAPGSTFYVVWKQGREAYESRATTPGLETALRAEDLFDNEPENVLLAKLTYWFPL